LPRSSSVSGAASFGADLARESARIAKRVSGTARTVTVGQALPGGGVAVVNGSYPLVWTNEGPDPSFGVTSPILVDEMTKAGAIVRTLAVDLHMVVTNFSSKVGARAQSFHRRIARDIHGYAAPINALDVSNSNTPGHVDPTNSVGIPAVQRAVVRLSLDGTFEIRPVNAYSGNNGRAAIEANGFYYMVGNAGNGSGTEPASVVSNTGVQLTTPGGNPETTVVGVQRGTPGAANGFQYGFSVADAGFAADKSGKDDNFRGVTVFANTLYVSKGSGSNGINTVYRVGNAGTLPTAANAALTPISRTPIGSSRSPTTCCAPQKLHQPYRLLELRGSGP
jgi:hypothetical protein